MEKTSFNLSPQPSSVMLEEDHKVEESCAIKNNKEAFSVVESVLYFTNVCLDKLGQLQLNEDPQLTQGWEVPKYQQVFGHIASLEGQEMQVKAKRPKPHCFNCGSEEHQMKEGPMPRNSARISEKRKEHTDVCGEANSQSFQQWHPAEEVEERLGRFKAGAISEALSVTDKSLPLSSTSYASWATYQAGSRRLNWRIQDLHSMMETMMMGKQKLEKYRIKMSLMISQSW